MSNADRIQGVIASKAIKLACRVATTGNITLSGLQTIDNVALAADDRVLVWQQTDTTTNGVYEASSSTWQRTADFDGTNDIAMGTLIHVVSGDTYSGDMFAVTTSSPAVGSALTITRQYGPAGGDVTGSSTTTFTNKSISLTSNTVTGTKAEFDTAVSDGNICFDGDAVTNLTMATSRLLGRTTASTGAVEEITVGTGLTLSGGSLSASGSGADTDLSNLTATGANKVCNAWVNFDGTGTAAIRDSFNVDSITDHGTGNYTVNFTSALPSANSAFVISYGYTSATVIGLINTDGLGGEVAPTTTSARMTFLQSGGGSVDMKYVSAAFFAGA